MTELIEYCGCKKALDAMNHIKTLTRRNTLLEVRKHMTDIVLNHKGDPDEIGMLRGFAILIEKMDMAEEA